MKKNILLIILLILLPVIIHSQDKPNFNTCIKVTLLKNGINSSQIFDLESDNSEYSIFVFDYRFNIYKDDYWEKENDEIIQKVLFDKIENDKIIQLTTIGVSYCIELIQYSENTYESGKSTKRFYLSNSDSDIVIKNGRIYKGKESIKFNKYFMDFINSKTGKS